MKRILLTFFTLLFSVFAYAQIPAQPFNKIIFLGDSLTDNGNLHRILSFIPKTPPYFEGRFSNGPSWAEYVAKYFYDKYYISSINYAYGGATAFFHHNPFTDTFVAPMTLQGEVYWYDSQASKEDQGKTLFVIWIGANDYLYETEPDLNYLTDSVIEKISWAVDDLVAKQQANKFLVMNLPDLSRTPYAHERGTIDRMHAISQLHNKKLATTIAALKAKYPSVQFLTVNISEIFDDLLRNPEKYNQQFKQSIQNTTQACWTQGYMLPKPDKTSLHNTVKMTFARTPDRVDSITNAIWSSPVLLHIYQLGEQNFRPCAHAEQYVFWDDLHPTAAVHQVLGALVVKQLEDAGLG